jgi:hypothetical protein
MRALEGPVRGAFSLQRNPVLPTRSGAAPDSPYSARRAARNLLEKFMFSLIVKYAVLAVSTGAVLLFFVYCVDEASKV